MFFKITYFYFIINIFCVGKFKCNSIGQEMFYMHILHVEPQVTDHFLTGTITLVCYFQTILIMFNTLTN